MASLRRVKGLLILNLVAVVGFLLFLARCRAPLKGWEAVQAVQSRAESSNLSYRGSPPVQQAVLKRLSLLEDIVYRQLNGKKLRRSPSDYSIISSTSRTDVLFKARRCKDVLAHPSPSRFKVLFQIHS